MHMKVSLKRSRKCINLNDAHLIHIKSDPQGENSSKQDADGREAFIEN